MSVAWNDDSRWWLDHQYVYVSKETRAARIIDGASRLVLNAADVMVKSGRNERFGLPADIRKAALGLRRLAEACVAELNEGDEA